jgi:hypothetical protein
MFAATRHDVGPTAAGSGTMASEASSESVEALLMRFPIEPCSIIDYWMLAAALL